MGKPVVEIARFAKNRNETLRIALDEWQGHRLLDVRVLVPLASHTDALTPTGKGVSINVALIPDLRAALDQAEAQARELGWIP